MNFFDNEQLLYAGMAEAYSRAFDYLKVEDFQFLKQHKFTKYLIHPKKKYIPGTYSINTFNLNVTTKWIQSKNNSSENYFFYLKDEWKKNNRITNKELNSLLEKSYSFKDFIRLNFEKKFNFLSAFCPVGLITDKSDLESWITNLNFIFKLSDANLESSKKIITLTDNCVNGIIEKENYNKRIIDEKHLGGTSLAENSISAIKTFLDEKYEYMSSLDEIIKLGGNVSEVSCITWYLKKCMKQNSEINWFFKHSFELNKLCFK